MGLWPRFRPWSFFGSWHDNDPQHIGLTVSHVKDVMFCDLVMGRIIELVTIGDNDCPRFDNFKTRSSLRTLPVLEERHPRIYISVWSLGSGWIEALLVLVVRSIHERSSVFTKVEGGDREAIWNPDVSLCVPCRLDIEWIRKRNSQCQSCDRLGVGRAKASCWYHQNSDGTPWLLRVIKSFSGKPEV